MRLLLGAKKPLIWSGMGTLLGEATAELKEFAELTGIPVSMNGIRSRLPRGAAQPNCTPGNWIKSCDVILALGSSLTRTPFGQQIPDGKTIIHNTEGIDEVKAQAGENDRETNPEFFAEIAKTKKEWMAEWSAKLSSDETPINTYRVIGEIERVLDHEHSIVTHDAGAPRDTLMPFYTATVRAAHLDIHTNLEAARSR